MRLIDADDLIEKINKKMPQGSARGVFKAFIDEQPTAYSVDKVVEELEENASRYTKKYNTPYGKYRDTKVISIRKAIEIVKQGGVSDD